MRSSNALIALASVTCLLTLAACSPTRVVFDGPPGTVMYVDDKPYHLPSQIEFLRPAGQGQSNRYNIGLVFKTSAGDVHAAGTIDVYGFYESDIDKTVTNQCRFSDTELTNLANGQPTVYKAVTASKQPLFDLTLNKK